MPNTLTKADIIEAIQNGNGYSRKQSSEVTEILLEIIKQTLESGEDVMVSGFGKFQVKDKKSRRGQNPDNALTTFCNENEILLGRLFNQD